MARTTIRIALVRATAAVATAGLLLLGIGAAPASADPVVSISGIVTVDGVPTAGVTVTAGFSLVAKTAVSDENGYYEFLDLATDWYPIGVLDPDDAYQSYSGSATLTAESPTAVVNVALLSVGPPTGTVSGTVTVDGVVAEGITVQAVRFGTTPLSDVSDAAGNFEITGLTYGTYQLTAVDPDDLYADTYSATFTISSTEQVASRDLAVLTWAVGTGSISGIVSDAATGLPLPGASLSIMGEGGGPIRRLTTTAAADGSYQFTGVPPTTVHVLVFVMGYAMTNEVFPILDGEHVVRDIELAPTNATIHGFVRDADGNGISGLKVDIHPSAGGPIAYTGPGGQYTIGPIAAGDYELTVGGIRTLWNKETLNVTAIANTTVEADFVIHPRDSGSMGGYVTGPGDGTYTKVCVSAYDDNGDIVADAGIAGSGEGGTWRIEDLEPGDYRLLFWDCDASRIPALASTFYGGAGSLADATPITVEAGDDLHVGPMNVGWGGTIEGHVNVETPDGAIEFPSGRSVDATVFQLVDGTWEPIPDPSTLASTGIAGYYEVRGLLPGTYRIGFIGGTGPRDYATEYFDDVATVDAADDIVVIGGETTGEIDATVAIPQPEAAPLAVATEALDPADKDGITLNKTVVAQGKTLDVAVGSQYAGEWVSVWGHSTPVPLGSWVQVPSTGIVTVPVPAALLAGTHTVVAQDAAGSVIGWAAGLQVTGVGGAPGLAALGATGGGVLLWAVPVGGAVVILGLALVLSRRRSIEATSNQ